MKYYAVKNGREPGIYNSWAECQKQIHGFKNASYKSFTSRKEAEEFISDSLAAKAIQDRFDKLSTKPQTVNGRTNNETVILKVF